MAKLQANAFVKLDFQGYTISNIQSSPKYIRYKKNGNKVIIPSGGNISQDVDGSIGLSDKKDILIADYIERVQVTTKDGDDIIRGTFYTRVTGYCSTGDGSDQIASNRLIELGASSSNGSGYVGMDDGNDSVIMRLTSSQPSYSFTDVGIVIESHVQFSAGEGDDSIYSEIEGYSGTNTAGKLNGLYLWSSSSIDMGGGNDSITGKSVYQNAIYVSQDSLISMGDGSDRFDAVKGGIYLGGSVDLGTGDDAAYIDIDKSVYFPNPDNPGRFDGGDGVDTAYLAEGFYTIKRDTRYSNLHSVTGGNSMPFYLNSFEAIGNAESGVKTSLHEGSLYVIDGGVFGRNNDGDFVPF